MTPFSRTDPFLAPKGQPCRHAPGHLGLRGSHARRNQPRNAARCLEAGRSRGKRIPGRLVSVDAVSCSAVVGMLKWHQRSRSLENPRRFASARIDASARRPQHNRRPRPHPGQTFQNRPRRVSLSVRQSLIAGHTVVLWRRQPRRRVPDMRLSRRHRGTETWNQIVTRLLLRAPRASVRNLGGNAECRRQNDECQATEGGTEIPHSALASPREILLGLWRRLPNGPRGSRAGAPERAGESAFFPRCQKVKTPFAFCGRRRFNSPQNNRCRSFGADRSFPSRLRLRNQS